MRKVQSKTAALCTGTGAIGQSIYQVAPKLAAVKTAQASPSDRASTAPGIAVDHNYSARQTSDRTNPATLNTQRLAGNQAPTVAVTSPTNNATFTGLTTIPLTVSAADTDGSVTKVEYYAGTSLLATATAAPFGASRTPAATGTYNLTAKATDNLGAVTTSAAVTVTVNAATAGGQVIPGRIEAVSYSAMFGIQTEPTTDIGGGLNVGYIDTGDWMDYSVTVQTAGSYAVQFRVAGWNPAAQLQLKIGSTVLATVAVPTTANGQAFATVTATATLPAGSQTLRVVITGGGFNFNWMDFARTGARSALATKAPGSRRVAGFPNPTEQTFYLDGVAPGATVTIRDAAGRRVQTVTLQDGAIDVRQLQAGVYVLTVDDGKTVEKVRMLKK